MCSKSSRRFRRIKSYIVKQEVRSKGLKSDLSSEVRSKGLGSNLKSEVKSEVRIKEVLELE